MWSFELTIWVWYKYNNCSKCISQVLESILVKWSALLNFFFFLINSFLQNVWYTEDISWYRRCIETELASATSSICGYLINPIRGRVNVQPVSLLSVLLYQNFDPLVTGCFPLCHLGWSIWYVDVIHSLIKVDIYLSFGEETRLFCIQEGSTNLELFCCRGGV